MRGSRGSGGGTVVVALSVLAALGVAMATRSVPPGPSGSGDAVVRAETATPQSLAMGGAVPAIGSAASASWTITSRQPRVSALYGVHFVNDQVGFVGGGGTLLATHDAGRSWTAAPIPDVGGSIAAISCTSETNCVAGGWTATDSVQLLYTRNGGSSWAPAQFPPGLRDLSHLTCWSPSRCLAVGQGSGQPPWELQSVDGGFTWTRGAGPPGLKALTTLTCSATGSCLAGGGTEPSAPYGVGVIDRSADGGRSWQTVRLPRVPPACSTPLGGTFTCSGPAGTVAAGTSTPSWPPTALSCPTADICYDENIGTAQLTSTDGGVTWRPGAPRALGCPSGQPFCPAAYLPGATAFVTPLVGYRTTHDQCGGFNFGTESYQSCPGAVEKTTDGGRTWVSSVSTDYLPAISCPDTNHCWAVETTNSSGSLIATADGGAHWSVVTMPGTGLFFNLTCASSSLCFVSGSDANGDPSVLRSSDGGRSWASASVPQASTTSTPPLVGPHAGYVAGLACMSATTCLASTTSDVLVTRNSGATWSAAGLPPRDAQGSAPVLFGIACANRSVCVVPTSSGLFRTVDRGSTWTRTGPRSGGSLSVVCAPSELCVADDLGSGGQNSTGILVSSDAGATWRAESISLPSGLDSTNSTNSQTPSQIYYVSCWDRAHCAALGLAYSSRGDRRWYVLNSGDAGASWSVSALPAGIQQVGSLACSTGGQCLIAGSDADGAAVWSMRGSHTRELERPTWAHFSQLTSLVCTVPRSCIGTAVANNSAIIFTASLSGSSSGWSDSLPTPRAAFSNIEVDITSAAVATGAALFITFPSQLFNLTFQENYAEIVAWGPRARRRLRRAARRLGLRSTDQVRPPAMTQRPKEAHDGSRLDQALLVGLTGALLGTLLNPAIALNMTTLEGYVGVAVALATSLGGIAVTLAIYRSRRRLEHPLRLRALPLGLVVAAGCVIISRLANFEPGYLYGVVCGVALGKKLREREEAHIAALSTVATLLVATVSWLVWVPVHHAAAHGGSFVIHVLDNALAALFISGLVNTVIVLFPLRFLAGWTVIRWRRDVWSASFVVALFGLVAVIVRSPASPGSHTSPLLVTIALFVLFGGGSVVFREYFARQWRQAHGVELHGMRAHVRELLSARPTDDVEVVSVPGSAQIIVEEEDEG